MSAELLVTIGRRVQDAFENLKATESRQHQQGTFEVALENQSQRFRLWAINMGLYQTGHGSLDYRFRDAPLVYSFARELLCDLERYLFISKISSLCTESRC